MELEPDTQQGKEKRFHVLAVDDSLVDRKLLEKLLKVSSLNVTCVDSVDKALEYLGLNSIDSDIDPKILSSSTSSSSSSSQQRGVRVNLIMTDFCMPGMSGYDLLKRVKGSSWKDVPVVVMSSDNVPSTVSMCLEEGAEEFLVKPLQLSDVKKLQPYLLKSLKHYYSCEIIDGNTSGTCNQADQTIKPINSNSNPNSTKRKAATPPPPETRPKFPQLAVV